MDEYRIEQMSVSDRAIHEVMELLHLTFPNRVDKFSFDYLKWQYVDNPRGHVIAYNAYSGNGEIAAHYAVIPIEMSIDGNTIKGVLSLNTATHPDHRGKRLFTILAQKTYDKAQQLGRKFVIGVANDNSTHGFLKNLGFYFISPLDVRIGVGNPYRIGLVEEKHHVLYDEETIKWRLMCPYYHYMRYQDIIMGRLSIPFFNSVVAKMSQGTEANLNELKPTHKFFNLYVGLGNTIKNTYFRLPKFIKRSPFNLIFKDMTNGELPTITKENIVFQLIDFDVA